MSDYNNILDKEFLLEKFEQLSLKMEQLTNEISTMKEKLDKASKMNRAFGLKSIKNSQPLEFAKEINGIGSPTKKYILSIRAITEEWKGRKNDILFSIRQQEKETNQDLKALGIRIPINDIKIFSILVQDVISLLYIACELKGLKTTDILREIIQEVNEKGYQMIQELKQKMVL